MLIQKATTRYAPVISWIKTLTKVSRLPQILSTNRGCQDDTLGSIYSVFAVRLYEAACHVVGDKRGVITIHRGRRIEQDSKQIFLILRISVVLFFRQSMTYSK
jgi:hypothetical protein